MKLKIIWGITGCGDYLQETINVMKEVQEDFNVEITVMISKQGELVLKWYNLLKSLNELFEKIYIEKGSNQPFLAGPLQNGEYEFLYTSPVSGNSLGKIVNGIADSLITNCISQAIKGYTPVYIYPVDQKPGDIITTLPNGKKLKIRMRKVDLNNFLKLKKMDGITVFSHPKEIINIIKEIIKKNYD